MHHPTPEQKALFEQAERYEEQEDPYNAIKLYKRTIKLGAAWVAPYARLGQIYKYRQEWKPALYYNKKAASLQADDPACWWNIGIAATALRKTRLARTVWAKFGLDAAPREPFPISIRRVYGKQYEILWALRRGPAEAIIQNIPHPQSGRCFGDMVLIDNLIKGHHSSAQHRLPIYEELGLLKRSGFFTFSCLLQSADRKDIQVLQHLCREQGLGFEVWANATRAFSSKQFGAQPEYFAMDWATEEELLVALAAPTGSRALGALDAWKAICLKDYTAFQAYRITE